MHILSVLSTNLSALRSETLSSDDVATGLDRVRNYQTPATAPPVMRVLTSRPDGIFDLKYGAESVKDFEVFGGLMIERGDAVGSFPVAVLVSKSRDAVVLWSSSAPLANLEFEALAACPDAAPRFLRRPFVLDGAGAGEPRLADRSSVTIEGHLPFLSLRIAKGATEFALICEEIAAAERAGAPMADRETDAFETLCEEMLKFPNKVALKTVLVGRSEASQDQPACPPAASALKLCEGPMLTAMASVVMLNAEDVETGVEGERLSEKDRSESAKSFAPINKCAQLERRELKDSIDVPESGSVGTFVERATLLSEIMRPFGFAYELVPVSDGGYLLENMAEKLFEDAGEALKLARGGGRAPDAAGAAFAGLETLRHALVDDEAVAVVRRSADGRLYDAKLVTSKGSVPKVDLQWLTRFVYMPAVRVVVADAGGGDEPDFKFFVLSCRDGGAGGEGGSVFAERRLSVRKPLKESTGDRQLLALADAIDGVKRQLFDIDAKIGQLHSSVPVYPLAAAPAEDRLESYKRVLTRIDALGAKVARKRSRAGLELASFQPTLVG